MKKTNVFLAFAVLAIGFTACEKDQDEVAPNKTETLTAKTWKVSAVRIDPPLAVGDTVISDMTEICDKDNTIKFDKNQTYLADEGSDKCNMEDTQTETGAWAFDATETTLIINGDSTFIKELNANSLKIAYQWDVETARTYRIVTAEEDVSSLNLVFEFSAQ